MSGADAKRGLGAFVVTGASSGIGRAIAAGLADLGCTVCCISRRGTIPDDRPTCGQFESVQLDVTDLVKTELVVTDFARRHPDFAGVVNAAGIHRHIPSDELTSDELRMILEIDLVVPVQIARFAVAHMRERGGWIVNIGSFYDRLGVPGSLGYAAAKAGLASATRTLAVEWARFGISTVNFAPGYVESGLNSEYLADPANRDAIARKIPQRRIAQPEEIASIVCGVLASQGRFLSGETIYIDGAQGVRL